MINLLINFALEIYLFYLDSAFLVLLQFFSFALVGRIHKFLSHSFMTSVSQTKGESATARAASAASIIMVHMYVDSCEKVTARYQVAEVIDDIIISKKTSPTSHLDLGLDWTFLTKSALHWFFHLPPKSVSSFSDLSKKFLSQFFTIRAMQQTSHSLVNLRQLPGECLKQYMAHFFEQALQIQDLIPKVALHAIQTSLRPGKFIDSLAKKPPLNIDDFRTRASRYIVTDEREADRTKVADWINPADHRNPRPKPNKKSPRRHRDVEAYTAPNTQTSRH
ncbi:hypothetical protein RJT34_16412 [Clitoria ternatea]|uniref:Retrotransposon gag domain-containing protein n=1 Tax=Clitoria ternatea TaxID=43366 RepID=A0AAN9JA65_CLITE